MAFIPKVAEQGSAAVYAVSEASEMAQLGLKGLS
jgi:hypothetical protein